MGFIFAFVPVIAVAVVGIVLYFVNKKKQEEQRKARAAEEQKKKEIEEAEAKKPFTLWDGREKPVEWFFGDDAKAVYDDCIANSRAMWDTLIETGKICLNSDTATELDGMSWVFGDVCENLFPEKSWLIVFYNEFMKSKYKNFGLEIKLRHFIVPLYWLMAVATIRDVDNERLIYPHPDCLMEDKNPMLYYFNRFSKNVFKYNIVEGIFTTFGAQVAMNYIFNGLLDGIDLSIEEWLYDESVFFTELKQLKSDSSVAAKIKELTKHPEYLPNSVGDNSKHSEGSGSKIIDTVSSMNPLISDI